MMKRAVICTALCAMMGVAGAATVWNPAGNGIAPPSVGYFDDAGNWTAGVPGPAGDTKAVFNVLGAAECVVTNAQGGFQMVMGDNGDESQLSQLRIASGGVLSTWANNWSAVGYNRSAKCVVEAGGTLNFGNHAWIGNITGSTGTLDVYGTVTVAQMIGIGWNPGAYGYVTVYPGGRMELQQLNATRSIGDGSWLDLWGDATATWSGNQTNGINGFIAAGKIMGNRLTNNLSVVLDVPSAGTTNTVVSAIPSIPNLSGLTLAETTNVLAQFGYTVGNISIGYEPGAFTGYVIGSVPAAGSAPLTNGAPVDVIIQQTSIPNLVGMTFSDATNILTQLNLTLGTVSNTYVFDVIPETVLGQNPVGGGSAAPGDPVDLTIMEPLASQTDVISVGSGNWMDPAIWNPNVVPERETQGFKVKGINDSVITLTNRVAVKTLVLGDGSSCQLDIMDGGHFVGGQFGDWNAIGYSASVTLNVYTGGVFEARKNVLYGWQNATSYMNIDGGSVVIGDWVSLGRNDGSSSSETTIKNGGSMICLRFRNDMTNGVITVYDGTFAMMGTGRINDIQNGLDAGTIKVAPGYSYTLSNETGDSVLTGFKPDYNAWAGTWGVDIGSETNDYDGDLANNFWEYGANGDPTNSANTGVDPVLLSSGGGLDYVHLSRADNTNLQYIVETTDDLVLGSWTNLGYVVAGTGTATNDYYAVTNSIDTAAAKKFIRLKIVNP